MASCGLADSSLIILGAHQQRSKRNLTFSPLVNALSPARPPPTSFRGACMKQLGQGRLECKPWLNRGGKQKVLQAVAVPMETSESSSAADDAELRKQLAERYGFQQIGEPLPDTVTLRDIITSLPDKVFEIDEVKAWREVLVSVASYALGLYMIAKAPWYLLPLAWAWTGTALSGVFVVGHDCAHKSFSRNKLLEDIVGTLAFMPLIFPYEPWRLSHDPHHENTNMLFVDKPWHPLLKSSFPDSPLQRKALIYAYGPFRWLMSIAHWLTWHFDFRLFKKQHMKRCMISVAVVYAFIGIGWPLIVYTTGIGGWVKFWLMPFLGFHVWTSTQTMIHHTAPHIPFQPANKWKAAQAQLTGTVHCDYPRWVEVLTHNVNVHIPHHISTKIPSYNLREAQKSLEENWGKYLNKATWNWRLMKTIMTTCHVYDENENYVSFERAFPEEAQPIAFLKRVMPG